MNTQVHLNSGTAYKQASTVVEAAFLLFAQPLVLKGFTGKPTVSSNLQSVILKTSKELGGGGGRCKTKQQNRIINQIKKHGQARFLLSYTPFILNNLTRLGTVPSLYLCSVNASYCARPT